MTHSLTSYADMLASLYWDIESLLAQYGDRALLSPSACEAMWSEFEALRSRLHRLRAEADAAPLPYRESAHRLLVELEQLLDVDHEGDDWEAYMGAAMIHAENRICDEARWIERSA
jgi:hypothetical protein